MKKIDDVYLSSDRCIVVIGERYFYFTSDDIVNLGKELSFKTYKNEHGVLTALCFEDDICN